MGRAHLIRRKIRKNSAPRISAKVSLRAAAARISDPVPDTLGERVYQALKRDIIRGVYQSGEAMSEKALAQRYRGSRTPVREAAVRLQQENLLRLVPNRGYFVTSITIKEMNDIYEFRASVEGACAELAATKGVDQALLEELTRFGRTPYQVDDRESYVRFIEADTAFHIGIARLTRNQLLIRTVSDMRCQMERIMFSTIEVGYFGEMPVREHCEILEAIVARNPELARRRMSEHILGSRDKVLQIASGRSRTA